MNVLSVNSLSKIGREAPLFSDVTFGLNDGEKAALIGRNGSGKSTLLACIAGKIQSDEGTVVTAKDCGISFLPQTPVYDAEDTIRDHIFRGEGSKLSIIREYEHICSLLSTCTNPSAPMQQEYERLLSIMEEKNLWTFESQIQSILSMLGLTDMNRKMGTLSGGMIKKVALAQVLIDDTRLLLLDEPTNHLDIEVIAWLEEYLCSTERAVLMVTHDRYFLDNVCSSIYELARGKVKLYTGNFSQYLEKKEIESAIEENTERRIESVLRKEREWLLRGPKARGTKARARVDAVNRMIHREKITKDKGFAFEIQDRRLGGVILELDHVSKSFCLSDGTVLPVVSDFSYIFRKGEKLGIYGGNGAGKTTLLNLITGTLAPDNGTVRIGENTHIGYYRQNPFIQGAAEEEKGQTVLEYIHEAAENITLKNGTTVSAERFLEQFAFEGKIQYSPVTALSGGERKRLYLVRLLISNPNFLVLDEPTNDFDIYTMSVLESFLEQYSGCLIVVSHDRCFMDKTVDMLLVLENGGIAGFVGSCSEYIAYKKMEQSASGQPSVRQEPQAHRAGSEEEKRRRSDKPRKRTYKEQKEFEQLENDIMENEERKTFLESAMSAADTDYAQVQEFADEYNRLCSLIEQQYARWEELGLLSKS